MKWARLGDRLLGDGMGGMHIGVEVGSVITRCGGMYAPRRVRTGYVADARLGLT